MIEGVNDCLAPLNNQVRGNKEEGKSEVQKPTVFVHSILKSLKMRSIFFRTYSLLPLTYYLIV